MSLAVICPAGQFERLIFCMFCGILTKCCNNLCTTNINSYLQVYNSTISCWSPISSSILAYFNHLPIRLMKAGSEMLQSSKNAQYDKKYIIIHKNYNRQFYYCSIAFQTLYAVNYFSVV